MSDAKQCDNCQELYTKPSEANDPHQTTVKQRGDWEHPAIGARISLYNERTHDLIDDCRKCTVLAVRKFMAKFDIKELKGETITTTVVRHSKTIYLGNPDEQADTATSFFNRYEGKRVRITVEVL